MKNFPNGFESWQETHFEVVQEIALRLSKDVISGRVNDEYSEGGTGAMYDLAEELTDIFEKRYEGYEWDGEFFDVIEEFLEEELG